ncbi:Tetratricopeptide repeat protein [compost metagenome]
MTIDTKSVAELTQAVELLGNNINRMAITMLICMLITIAFTFFIIRYYEKLSNHALGRFDPDKASKLFDSGRVPELLAYCVKFIKKHPNDVNILFHLGRAQYTTGDFKEAQLSFQRAAELNPHYRSVVNPYLDEIRAQEVAAREATTI